MRALGSATAIPAVAVLAAQETVFDPDRDLVEAWALAAEAVVVVAVVRGAALMAALPLEEATGADR